MKPYLPPKMQRLYDFLDGKGDTPIVDIHNHIYGDDVPDLRNAQQRIGSSITRLNRRLVKSKQAVKPGRIKGTYALVSL